MASTFLMYRCMRCGLLMARAHVPQRCAWCGSIWSIQACDEGRPPGHQHASPSTPRQTTAGQWVLTAFDRALLQQFGIKADD
jgi:hypothetical protein